MIFRNWVLQNFPFLEDDFDALTDYELFCKMMEYVKLFAKDNEEFRKELDTYKNYFNNLDVQEEINNKLDEMALDGTLENIISQYIELATTYVYDTVANMKSATNLLNGSYARTSGFRSYNDRGGAYYKIRNVTNEDTPDDMFLLRMDDESLVAELIYTDINILALGAYTDTDHDIYPYLNGALTKLASTGGKLIIPKGNYILNTPIVMPQSGKSMLIDGCMSTIYVNIPTNNATAFTFSATLPSNYMRLSIHNLEINNQSSVNVNGMYFQHDTQREILNNVRILNFYKGIEFNQCWNVSFNNVDIGNCSIGVQASDQSEFNDALFNECVIRNNNVNLNLYTAHSVTFNECDLSGKKTETIDTHSYFNRCYSISFNNCYYEDPTKTTKGFRFVACQGIVFNGCFFLLFSDVENYYLIQNESANEHGSMKILGCYFVEYSTMDVTSNIIKCLGTTETSVDSCTFKNFTGVCIYASNNAVVNINANDLNNVSTFFQEASASNYIYGNILKHSDYSNCVIAHPTQVKVDIIDVLKYGATTDIPSGYYIGQQYFDTTTNTLKIYNGSSWV